MCCATTTPCVVTLIRAEATLVQNQKVFGLFKSLVAPFTRTLYIKGSLAAQTFGAALGGTRARTILGNILACGAYLKPFAALVALNRYAATP